MGLKLTATLGLDGSGFKAGFRQAKAFAEGMAEELKHVIIGAIGVVTVEEALRKTVETAKELVETSERLAIAPEQLQLMRQAAKNAGLDIEKLTDSFDKLGVARQKALIPGQEGLDARRAFAAAGIGVDQLRSMGTAQLFMGPLATLAKTRNAQDIGIIFRELGIKSFGGLIPVLKTNFDELSERMHRFGMFMDTETAVKLKNVTSAFSGLANTIYAFLGPSLVKLAEWAMDVVSHSEALEGALFSFVQYVSEFRMKGTTIDGVEYSAKARRDAAVDALELMRQYQNKGKTIDEYLSDRKGAFVTPDTAGALGREGMSYAALGDDLSKSWREELNYLNSLIQPLADNSKAAATGSAAAMDEMRKSIENWKKEMSRLANELDHPGALDEGPTIGPKLPRKALVEQSDSLVKIGNFLGGSDRIINHLAQRQVDLLQKIVHNTDYLPSVVRLQPTSIMMGPHFPHT